MSLTRLGLLLSSTDLILRLCWDWEEPALEMLSLFSSLELLKEPCESDETLEKPVNKLINNLLCFSDWRQNHRKKCPPLRGLTLKKLRIGVCDSGDLQGVKKRKSKKPAALIKIAGTMKLRPQLYSTKEPAITAPNMLPTLVWEFHIPNMSPREDFPNQLPTDETTAGHPVVCRAPSNQIEMSFGLTIGLANDSELTANYLYDNEVIKGMYVIVKSDSK